MKKSIKIISVVVFILLFLLAGIIIITFLGVLQKPAQPDLSDICYGTDLEILECFYSTEMKKAIVDVKLNSGSLDGIQGIISGKIDGNLGGSEEKVMLTLNANDRRTIEFNFKMSVDGKSLDNFEGPFKFQVRPIIEGKICIQFDTKRCNTD